MDTYPSIQFSGITDNTIGAEIWLQAVRKNHPYQSHPNSIYMKSDGIIKL